MLACPSQGAQARGQGDNARVLARFGGMVETREEVRSLGPSPRQGLLTVGQSGNRGGNGLGRRGGDGADVTGEERVGDSRSVLVIVKQPGEGLIAVTNRVKALGEGTGMLAEQIVQPVPAMGRFGEQVVVIQGLQAAPGDRQVDAV